MEDELKDAIALYEEQLESIAGVIAEDPANEEALQLKQQLQEALEFTRSAYEQACEGHDGPGSVGSAPPDYDTAENLAIAAAAASGAADDVDPRGTGLADTAAAARAAAARERGASLPPASSSQHQSMDDAGTQSMNTGGVGDASEVSGAGTAAAARAAAACAAAPSDASVEQGVQQGGAAPLTAPEEQPVGRGGRNNARMHPRNKYYREEPDFGALAEAHPELRPFLAPPHTPGGRHTFDYTSWAGTRQLTATLLKADFGLEWWLPEGQLVPPVTNRANYVHWLEDLVTLSAPEGAIAGGSAVRGLDIGCGANMIYCLLGAAIYGWHMVGLDVTDVAQTWCEQHIQSNPHLAALLEFRRSSCPLPDAVVHAMEAAEGPGAQGGHGHRKRRAGAAGQQDEEGGAAEGEEVGGILIPAFTSDDETFAFTMCNPPFFNSMDEAGSNPATACGGTAAEMIYPGGELAFIMRMVEDSVRLGGRVHWYTSMVGKKATLKALRKELHVRHVTAIRTTEFAQGKTSRWAIAWSFAVDANLAAVPLARPVNPILSAPIVPKRSTTFSIKAPKVDSGKMLGLVAQVLSAHGATCTTDPMLWRVTATLSHAAFARLGQTNTGGSDDDDDDSAAAGLQGQLQLGSRSYSGQLVGAGEVAAGMGPRGGALPQPKRQRGTPSATSGAMGGPPPTAPTTASGPSALSIRVTLFQQQRGQYELTSSIPNTAGLTEATRFTRLMAKVNSDLTIMCA